MPDSPTQSYLIPASVALMIGQRYAFAKRRQQFISFVSLFSFIGMALGTLALIVVLSVMNGFDREIKQRILSVVPHGFVQQDPVMRDWPQHAAELQTQKGIVSLAPYISGFVMLTGQGRVEGMELQAVLPAEEKNISIVHRSMLDGDLDDLKPGEFGLVLGDIAARNLRLGVGDAVRMTLPQVSVTLAGLYPRSKRFRVVGIFSVGAQVDQNLALIHLADAQRLFRLKPDEVHGLRVKTGDIQSAPETMRQLRTSPGNNYEVKDWSQTQGSLFQAIQLEKRMVTLLLMVIVFVAALNIITSLVLMVADKRHDIAVLKTMGMSSRSVMLVFIYQGTMVGGLGVLSGGVLGVLLALNFSAVVRWFENLLGLYVFDPNVYFISQIPSQLRASDVLLVAGTGLLLSTLATIYPALRASRVAPAEALRYQ